MPRAARSIKVRDPATGAEHALTPKQYALAKILAGGGVSQAEAYRQAYRGGRHGNPPTEYQQASILSHKPEILASVELLRDRMEQPALRDAAAIREHVIAGLTSLSREADCDSVRIRAMELLGKVQAVGLFVERREVIHKHQAGPATSGELLAKLRSLVSSQVIEVEPLRMEPEVQAEVSVIPADPELSTVR